MNERQLTELIVHVALQSFLQLDLIYGCFDLFFIFGATKVHF